MVAEVGRDDDDDGVMEWEEDGGIGLTDFGGPWMRVSGSKSSTTVTVASCSSSSYSSACSPSGW